MSYDEKLAGWVRGHRHGAAEKEMFGGFAFLLGGRVCFGIIEKNLEPT